MKSKHILPVKVASYLNCSLIVFISSLILKVKKEKPSQQSVNGNSEMKAFSSAVDYLQLVVVSGNKSVLQQVSRSHLISRVQSILFVCFAISSRFVVRFVLFEVRLIDGSENNYLIMLCFQCRLSRGCKNYEPSEIRYSSDSHSCLKWLNYYQR